MATSTPASTVATTTPASSPTRAAPSASPTSGGGLFSKAGSPALVLAFLAIGIFAGGLLSMMFLRHIGILRLMRQRHAALRTEDADAASAQPPAMSRRRRRVLGEKPKLWEYGCQVGGKNRNGWQYVMPIAATSVQPAPTPLPPVQGTPRATATSRYRRRITSVGRWVRGFAPSAQSPPSDKPDSDHSDLGKLHLTFAIAMPTQFPEPRTMGSQRAEVPIFELGFMDVPWSEEKCVSLNAIASSPDGSAGPSNAV